MSHHPQRPRPPLLASLYQEMRWLNGWIASGIAFGFVLSLLEAMKIGVTSSVFAAIVQPIVVTLGLLLFGSARLVSHPYRAREGTPTRDFYWNWFCACAVLTAATLMSFVASPALKAYGLSSGSYLLGSLLFLAVAGAVFLVITTIVFNRAVRFSAAQEAPFPQGRRMAPALADFLAHMWRTLAKGDR